jgi:hypothetical protein
VLLCRRTPRAARRHAACALARCSDADACALFELKKTAGAVAEEAGHREVAALLAAAQQQQARDPAAAAARLRRRQQADEAVERKAAEAISKEHQEVEEVERQVLARCLGLEVLMTLLLKPCGPPRNRRPVRLETPKGGAAAAAPAPA